MKMHCFILNMLLNSAICLINMSVILRNTSIFTVQVFKINHAETKDYLEIKITTLYYINAFSFSPLIFCDGKQKNVYARPPQLGY